MLKVATPPTAFAVVVPPTPDGAELMLTDAVEVVTRLPSVSCTCTATAGVSTCPAVLLDGCTEKASFAAVPAAIATAVLVAFDSPVDVAVSV